MQLGPEPCVCAYSHLHHVEPCDLANRKVHSALTAQGTGIESRSHRYPGSHVVPICARGVPQLASYSAPVQRGLCAFCCVSQHVPGAIPGTAESKAWVVILASSSQPASVHPGQCALLVVDHGYLRDRTAVPRFAAAEPAAMGRSRRPAQDPASFQPFPFYTYV